jgi:methionine synthase I (cobalamin-dependent)/5,10-methylenetetrahydrofolate reductase
VTFREFLQESDYILFDGGIGTQTYSKGIPRGHCYDELNISMPEVVLEIHREYIEAGAQVLTTNTFGANRAILEEYYDLGSKAREINYYGARLAKQSAKDRGFVAGSVGPITRPLDRETSITKSQAETYFRQQIEALLEGGADLILFETFADLDELLIGIETAKKLERDLFVIASMSFPNDGGLTLFGMNPYQAASRLDDSQADALGSNCGSGPQSVFETVKKLGQVSGKELAAQPNAGLAQFVQGKFYYPSNPEYFARYGEKFLAAGVRIIGGCCGTTPEHIRALAGTLQGKKPGKRRLRRIAVTRHKSERQPENITSPLKTLLDQGSVLALEVDPPKDPDFERLSRKLEPLAGSLNVINVSDSPMARPRMSPIATGRLLKESLGLEIIVHYTCRDRNILGIQSDLLGAAALGLDNFLVLGGDPPSIGDYPFATGVYDLTSEGLVGLISSLNQGVDLLGNPLGKQSGFLIGIGLGIGSNREKELNAARSKIRKGAHFVITQPVFQIQESARTLEDLHEAGIPVILSIMPLVSGRNAEYVHFEVPGISIPQNYLGRMEGTEGSEGEQEGIRIAREIIQALRPLCSGILYMPPLGKYHLIAEFL